MIRDAEAFVTLHEHRGVVTRCQTVAAEWRQEMGLERTPSQARMTPTLTVPAGTPGVDFLGFRSRQDPVGKPKSGKDCRGRWPGFTTHIKPSKIAIQSHVDKLRKIVDSHKHAAPEALIGALNPVMLGWPPSDAPVVSAKVFQGLGHIRHRRLWAWAVYRPPNRKKHWLTSQYGRVDAGRGGIFQPPDGGPQLYRHEHRPIRRDVHVQASRSPDDGGRVYGSSRLGRHPDASPRVARLRKRHQGACRACELFLTDGDVMEVDPLIPKTRGGTAAIDNLQLLHRHGHAGKTARELGAHGMDDNRQGAEEPDERKRARPVWSPSRHGDVPA